MIGTWSAAIVYQDEEVEVIDLEEGLQAEDAAGMVLHSAWELERVDLNEAIVSPGGTAEPRHRLYILLPEAVAFRLAATPYRTDGGSLRFRVVSSGDQGVKLVSLPSQRYERRGQTWYYSGCLTNTVHAVPFASRFRVHVTTGIRRWAARLEISRWKLGGAPVLLDSPWPWPEGPDHGYWLMVNTLGYDWRLKRGCLEAAQPRPPPA